MKIHTETHHTIYIGDTDITAVVIEGNQLSHISISSVNISNINKLLIDNLLYLENITENKKDLKQNLVPKDLWEKGVVKAIKKLMKKV